MNRFFSAALAFGLFVGVPLSWATPAMAVPATVTIRFFDKRIYYENDPIYVKIAVVNESPVPFRFKLAENRSFSVQFDGRTPSNLALDPSDAFKRTMASSSAVYYRDIALQPGEEYSFIEDIRAFLAIPGPGAYTVQVRFFPELVRAGTHSEPLLSNVLMLSVRPGMGIPTTAMVVSEATGEIVKAERIPPDEVVRRTIIARQKGNWEEFFIYLDLESMATREAEKKRVYLRESDEGRRRMIDRYRADLERSVVDNDISTIPTEFRILETKYAEASGSVRVLEKFRMIGYTAIKEYTYELVKRDDVWRIVDYVVVNKGTE